MYFLDVQASSLDIEGLNLEGCSSYVPIESASDHQGAISQTLQLLDELLREAPVVMESSGGNSSVTGPSVNMAACAGAAGCAGAVALAAGADGVTAPQLPSTKTQLQGTGTYFAYILINHSVD